MDRGSTLTGITTAHDGQEYGIRILRLKPVVVMRGGPEDRPPAWVWELTVTDGMRRVLRSLEMSLRDFSERPRPASNTVGHATIGSLPVEIAVGMDPLGSLSEPDAEAVKNLVGASEEDIGRHCGVVSVTAGPASVRLPVKDAILFADRIQAALPDAPG